MIYSILAVLLARPFLGWSELGNIDEKGLLSAIRFEKYNATYHYLLGRYYHSNLANPQIKDAIHHYSLSLKLNPLQPGTWLNLARAFQAAGQTERARYALERAVSLNQNNPRLMWDAGTSWLMSGMTDKAISTLKRYILLMPERQTDVYDLCWKLHLGNSYILRNLVPDSYEYQSSYLLYLLNSGRINESLDVWDVIDQERLEKKVFISFVNTLINHGFYKKAANVWAKHISKIEEVKSVNPLFTVWNPGFEKEILSGGFDWVIREAQGVDVFIDDAIRLNGDRSLGVSFDGNHNPEATIAQQVVRVTPGRWYSLGAYIKTSSITTRNGISLQVWGHKCQGLNKKTDSVTGTTFWKNISLDFQAPAQCKAVVVSVSRSRSDKLDNMIKGTAWIDAITMKRLTGLPKISSRKP
jgi:hypothetical protein